MNWGKVGELAIGVVLSRMFGLILISAVLKLVGYWPAGWWLAVLAAAGFAPWFVRYAERRTAERDQAKADKPKLRLEDVRHRDKLLFILLGGIVAIPINYGLQALWSDWLGWSGTHPGTPIAELGNAFGKGLLLGWAFVYAMPWFTRSISR